MKARIYNEDTLADLEKAFDIRGEVFESDALTFAGKKVDEEQLVRDILEDLSTIKLGERDIELPGLKANMDLAVGAVSKFKKDVYEGNIKPAITAGHDDIVVEFAREKVISNMQATGVNNFKGTAPSEGAEVDIIPAKGISGDATLADEEWLFFTGDFIDLNSDAVLTATQYANVDGNTNLHPEPHLFSERDSDIQMNQISGQLIKSKVDIDSYAQEAGSFEFVPVAIHIAKGEHVPGLS